MFQGASIPLQLYLKVCVYFGVSMLLREESTTFKDQRSTPLRKRLTFAKQFLRSTGAQILRWEPDLGCNPQPAPPGWWKGWSHPPSRSLFRASLKFVPLGLRIVETAGRWHTFSFSESQKEPLLNHTHGYSSSWSDCPTKVNYDKTVLSSKDLHPPNSIPRKF